MNSDVLRIVDCCVQSGVSQPCLSVCSGSGLVDVHQCANDLISIIVCTARKYRIYLDYCNAVHFSTTSFNIIINNDYTFISKLGHSRLFIYYISIFAV